MSANESPFDDRAYASLRGELATIFGSVTPRPGQTWNEAMLARITERLIAEHDGGYREGLADERL